MIQLLKYTYMMQPEKVKEALDSLWNRYQAIVTKTDSNWEEINEARAILYLTGQVYCEQIAVKAIERRLHLLQKPIDPVHFFNLIDTEDQNLVSLRGDQLFKQLEAFYRVVKAYKNKNVGGEFYLNESKFIKKHEEKNPNKGLKMGYRGKFM